MSTKYTANPPSLQKKKCKRTPCRKKGTREQKNKKRTARYGNPAVLIVVEIFRLVWHKEQ